MFKKLRKTCKKYIQYDLQIQTVLDKFYIFLNADTFV